jgi:3-hydroxyacyl-[acyl-carrier-protein] dehydratase
VENESVYESLKLPFSIKEVQLLLPHRYPFLLLDRVTEYIPGVSVSGFKNVTANEQFFQGHFPEKPVFPGVLMLEALAQLGVIYAKMETKQWNCLVVFAGCEDIKFRQMVLPGDRLDMKMSYIARKLGVWKMQGTILVDGKPVMEGILKAAEMR